MRELYLITQVFHNCGRWNTKKVFCFHTFEPFRNLTRHCTADLSADIFVYMTYRQFFYTWYSFHELDRVEITHGTMQLPPNAPGANTPGTTAPWLDDPFTNAPSRIKPWRRLWKSLTRHDSCLWKKASPKRIPSKKLSRQKRLPRKRPPTGKGTNRLKRFWSKLPTTGPEKKACH